jgi:DNA polymerase Ligase (LigD)
MPRFVILEHDYPILHWDLMLEVGSELRTWRLGKEPVPLGDSIEATPLGDHRVAYLDYEGPVSGGRGTVRRWDRGVYETLPVVEGEAVKVVLKGEKIHAIAVIKAIATQWVFQIQP